MRITTTYHQPNFLCGGYGLNSGTEVCKAGTLQTEPSFQTAQNRTDCST